MKRKETTFISLFSGCGGLDLGFSQAGFKCLAAYDLNKHATDTLHKNTGCNVHNIDLSEEDIDFDSNDQVDVVLSGSPCQGFSTMGKRELDDPRNHLLLTGASIALKLKPKVFIAENVPGAISGKHKKYWDNMHSLFEEQGYYTQDLICNGTDYGVPQLRKRVFFIATAKLTDQIKPVECKGGVLKDAISSIAKDAMNHEEHYLDESCVEFRIANRIKQGQKLSNVRGGSRSIHTWDIPEVFGKVSKQEKEALNQILKMRRQNRKRDWGDSDPIDLEVLYSTFGKGVILSLVDKGYLRKKAGTFDLSGAFNGKFRRLEWNKPANTVDTRFGNPKYFLHPSKNRGFTVREAACIQGFPHDYKFSGPTSEQYKMIGNAVPPPMAHQLAQAIKSKLF
jgi:DNA (cytosine-5)-methyltransferase 1